MADDAAGGLDRRTLLATLAGGAAASVAGCSATESGEDAPVSEVEADRAAEVAEQFAPTLYFDEHEQWFPTDPRPFESEVDGETVVEGFDALNGYVEATDDAPPTPAAFYNVAEYEDSPLAVVQYWLYSAFDQFTTNFHWHDWEVLQVFFDTDTEEPQLYVASSHSRKVPNNEFLDPDPERQPRILTELGSHSSGLSVNDAEDQFQRLTDGEGLADITNSVVDSVEAVAEVPLAYGLPRDEGATLPYVVPELDGAPVYEHERLPAVDSEDLVDEDLTVRSFDDLQSPPEDLPERETGLRFDPAGAETEATDVAYELVPSAELEHITDFTGPQLSFEFRVPKAAEDAISGHITTTKVPWRSDRYTAPASDITEPAHRAALAERYEAIGEPAAVNQVVASVTSAISSDDAPEDEGLTTTDSTVETVALLESEPEAVPTFGGIAVVRDVPEGEHRLTVNGAGIEPHSETVSVGEGVTAAGVEGEIPTVASENAVKVAVDPTDADADLTHLAVEDDFAGRLYDAPLSGPDAVYVHRGGAFTTEVRDSDDEVGAFRVNPADEERVAVENPDTGKAPLATYLADVAAETRDAVAAVEGDGDSDDDDDDTTTSDGNGGGGGGQENAVRGLENALDAVAAAARRAASAAENGNGNGADRRLETVSERLERVATRLSAASDSLPDGLANATEKRLDQSRRRADQAKGANKL